MDRQIDERGHWDIFLNQKVKLSKRINHKDMLYVGTVIQVFSDKLILNDRKLGEIPLSFEGLSVIG